MENMTRGYCTNCECNVDAETKDCGIGPFEYWGSKETHRDMRTVCVYCETEVEVERPEPEEEQGA